MKRVILLRTGKSEKAIFGVLLVLLDGVVIFTCRTIERLDKSFPDGVYPLKLEHSPRFKTDLWELYGIHGRAEIKIHVVNYWYDLDGCIGVGSNYADINKDGELDTTGSRQTLGEFHLAMATKTPELQTSFNITVQTL